MAGGWSRDGGVQEQIDASIEDAVESARQKIGSGPSLKHCADCDEPIPEARRAALPGVSRCITCQEQADALAESTGINRRGSKDSQLR